MRLHRSWGAVAVGLGLVAAGAPLVAQEADAGIPLGATPPAVTIADLDGRPVPLAQVIGTGPALVEFWATWCPLCRALEPRLKAAHAQYGTRVKFVAVAVAVNETPASIRRHLARHPLPFPLLWDSGGAATRAFQAPSTSYIVVLDGRGAVVYTGVGADQDLAAPLARAAGTP
ncbi:MAG TPA: TlpA disulfide reductase family protein [Gemmatimonadales bacterium]|nr:TlpA disulfide reductase family protein [Gemmatimonadales bacterium]